MRGSPHQGVTTPGHKILHSLLTTAPGGGYEAGIAWAKEAKANETAPKVTVGTNELHGSSPPVESGDDQDQDDEFEQEIDPEEYESPDTVTATGEQIKVYRKDPVKVRTKGAE